MFVDQTSLLLALGFAAFALASTLFVTWLSTRSDWFILTWASGAAVLVAAFACFSIYAVTADYLLGWFSIVLLVTGFVIFYGAACLFTEKRLPRRRVALLGLSVLGLVTAPFLVGFDALGATLGNLVNAGLLFATAYKFWGGRAESPVWITGIVALYTLAGLSFIPCAIVIQSKSTLVLEAPPSGWAEDLNSIVGLVSITGIGALSLALNQARAARHHHDEARRDALTGLLNRRALLDLHGKGLDVDTAIIVFDLDHFKTVNDHYGHATGDEVLRRFAATLADNVRSRDVAARMGGEEFALVLPKTTVELAVGIAERIRSHFELETMASDMGSFQATVSAGVAMAGPDGESFDEVLQRADKALYAAKDSGRNRVVPSSPRLVA